MVLEKNRLECLSYYKSTEIRALVLTYMILEKCPHKKEMSAEIEEIKTNVSVTIKKMKTVVASMEKMEPDLYSLPKKEIEANERLGKVKTRDKELQEKVKKFKKDPAVFMKDSVKKATKKYLEKGKKKKNPKGT